MKIAIFGATGQTGRHLARLALEGGHEVTALLRDPSRLVTAEQIRVVFGTADDAVAIADVLAGSDCAVSALSSGSGTLAGFARTAIPIMEKSGPRRLVSLVGAGVAEPDDPFSVGRSLMLGLMSLMAGDVLADATEHARLLRASSLNWTVSAPQLRLGPAASLSRADWQT